MSCAPASRASAISVSSALLPTTISGTERDACCLSLDDIAYRGRQAVGEEAQQLRSLGINGLGQRLEFRDPVAAYRMTAVPQRAVHELDVVLTTAQYD